MTPPLLHCPPHTATYLLQQAPATASVSLTHVVKKLLLTCCICYIYSITDVDDAGARALCLHSIDAAFQLIFSSLLPETTRVRFGGPAGQPLINA